MCKAEHGVIMFQPKVHGILGEHGTLLVDSSSKGPMA